MADRVQDPSCSIEAEYAPLIAVSAVFSSLSRGIVCLDHAFRVLHVSDRIETLLGAEQASSVVGRPVEELLGRDMFGPDGAMRVALAAGEKREGYRAFIETRDGARPLSISAAPFVPDVHGICDRRVAYIVVVRPAEEDTYSGTGAPTFFSGLIARSAAMAKVFGLIENLRSSDATILLTGESGTGKEVVSRAIHANSPHRNGPFVAVNCGALPSELLESELFGHVRGAFTSAIRDRVGRFEAAAKGTLFLDEIGDLPLPLQVKLLRVLQERRFERVGESRSIETDARIVAATNVDLRRAVAEGRFREDLFYRLRVVPIEIPPLRDRREDIEPLARYLLHRVAGRHGRDLQFSPDALRAMLDYPWPGNVRELENALEYAVSVGKGQTLQIEDLPDEIVHPRAAQSGGEELEREQTRSSEAGELAEERRIRQTLERVRWNRMEAAKELGMSRTTLWRRMRELHID
ncbi:MAG: sigma 54-interacting transcriptional regulator [Acidobacteria bacterium]|nr:sigma 54-interacting transcriptional regulator [Acidobacteriota bacterium]